MEPIRLVTVKIQQERVPTLGFATFLLKTLTYKLAQFQEDAASVAWLKERGMYEVSSFHLLRASLRPLVFQNCPEFRCHYPRALQE